MPPKISLESVLHERLRLARAATGLSQEAAADLAGTTGQTVYDWEGGRGADAWAKRLRYLEALASENAEARRIVLSLVGVEDISRALRDPQVAEVVTLLQEARARPGWDHLYFTLRRLLEPREEEVREAPATSS